MSPADPKKGATKGASKPGELVRAVEFEGHKVTTVVWEGRPVWIAREVGEALGYPNEGARFADKVRSEWAEEFIEGVDFEMLTNGRLATFKELPTVSVGSQTKALLVLTESGLHLALLKTRKPAGQRLRRLLATEVLPQLVRTGQYAPTAATAPALPAPPTGETLPPVRLAIIALLGPHIAELYRAGDVKAAKIAAQMLSRLMRKPRARKEPR